MFLSLDSESLMIKKVTITIGNTDIGSTSVENKVLIVLSAKGSELENLKSFFSRELYPQPIQKPPNLRMLDQQRLGRIKNGLYHNFPATYNQETNVRHVPCRPFVPWGKGYNLFF
jgi:hypothetical protein